MREFVKFLKSKMFKCVCNVLCIGDTGLSLCLCMSLPIN